MYLVHSKLDIVEVLWTYNVYGVRFMATFILSIAHTFINFYLFVNRYCHRRMTAVRFKRVHMDTILSLTIKHFR